MIYCIMKVFLRIWVCCKKKDNYSSFLHLHFISINLKKKSINKGNHRQYSMKNKKIKTFSSPPYLSSKLLQSTNINWSFLSGIQIAATNTEIWCWTHHSACQAKWIVRKNHFGSSIVVLREKGKGKRNKNESHTNEAKIQTFKREFYIC